MAENIDEKIIDLGGLRRFKENMGNTGVDGVGEFDTKDNTSEIFNNKNNTDETTKNKIVGVADGQHYIHIEGLKNTVDGTNATDGFTAIHIEGWNNTASASNTHVEGEVCTASALASHVEGSQSRATAKGSHAENSSSANGEYSHSEGFATTAQGNKSHVGGYLSYADGEGSFAHGLFAAAENPYEVSFGQYNKSNSDTLFSVGNGTATTPSNAFEITKTGGKLHGEDIATVAEIEAHTSNADIHVTAADKESWNGKTTITGAAQVFSNPNLLINPDFRINQRGQTEYTNTDYSEKYTLDRWLLLRNSNIGTNGVKVTNSGFTKTDTENSGALVQFLPDDIVDFISGKTCTMSAGISTGEIISKTFVYDPSKDGQAEIVPIDFSNNKYYIQFWHWSKYHNKRPCIIALTWDTSVTINWIKLELGSIATPFVPPDPATELLKCQRYYQRIRGLMNHFGSGFIGATSAATIVCPIMPVRKTPTIGLHGAVYINTNGYINENCLQSTECFISSNDISGVSSLNFVFKISAPADVVGQGCTAQFRDTDSYIELNAEL